MDIIKLDIYKKWENEGSTGIKSECCDEDVIIEWFDNRAYAVCSGCSKQLRLVAKKRDIYGCY